MGRKQGRRRSKGSAERAAPAERPARRDWRAAWWLVAPVLAFVAYRGASRVDFVGDARFLIADNAFVKSTSFWWGTLTHDYFWSSSGQIIPYWRPLTKLSWLLEWRWFHAWSGGYAWVNVLWHALGSLGVGLLARKVGLGRTGATLAALAHALHPVAIEPVTLIMARSDVAASTASVWAVVCWREWRERSRVWPWAAAHTLLVTIAVGSKEVAIVLPAVLMVWAALERDFAKERRERLLSLAPATAVALGYYGLRHVILERQAHGLSATALAFDPLRLATGVAWYLRSGFPFRLASGLREVPIAEAESGAGLASTALTLGLALALAIRAARRGQTAFVALGCWALLGLSPVLLTRDIAVPSAPDRFSLADRWLYFSLGPLVVAYVSAGAELWAWMRQRWAARARALEIGGPSLVAVWAAVLLWRSNADRAELASDLAMLDNEDRVFYQQIPEPFRTHWDECRHEQRILVKALMQGRASDAAAEGARSLKRCGEDPDVALYYLDALVQLRRFEDAEPLARRLVESPPKDIRNHGRLAFLAGETLLERGDTSAAAPLLEKAVRLGQATCRSFISLAEAAKARGRVVEAAGHLETAYQCGGRRDASLRVAAATWLVEAGERKRAERALDGIRGLSLTRDQAEQVSALLRALGLTER
jgi:tetratricopeptide (TPR) repeat protein